MWSDRFLITGLPRSRTGWLANLFTYGCSFCLHDGSRYDDVWAKLESIAEAHPELSHLGNSDSGAALTGYGRAHKVVVVRRAPAEALASFLEYFTKHPYPQAGPPDPVRAAQVFHQMEDGLEQMKSCVPADRLREVPMEALEERSCVEGLWNFIVPDEEFSQERWEVLDGLAINPMSRKVARNLWA